MSARASESASATLLALTGARFDLGFSAECVRRVIAASDGDAQGAMNLFLLLGADEGPATRLVALGLDDGSELIVTAHAAIEVLTPATILPLPRIVTRHAPWLDALVLPPSDATDSARPLLVVAPNRLPNRPQNGLAKWTGQMD
jgi:hypothetical protein